MLAYGAKVKPGVNIGTRSTYADLAATMARASVAAGADALMVETHPEPAKATSDGAQTINAAQFADMMNEVRAVARAIGRDI